MDPAELHIARISLQLAATAMQAALAYNQAQSTLDLESVLEADRLTSQHGRAVSRETVEKLTELTVQHKEMFSKFLTAATSQVVAAADELPAEQRDQVAASFAGSLNWNLSMQAQFYEGRQQWIAAATEALNLAEAHKDQIWLEGSELVIGSDALLTELQELVAIMDGVREKEVAMLHERQGRLAAAASKLKSMS